jgi:hypothetical protein
MDTIPELFSLRNPPTNFPVKRVGFRVPFGLREGRAWAPGEVNKGKACGCICPGCHAPLAAKAQTSRRRRPHFAHLTDTGCQTGRETGIHLRAKQVIAERGELLVPAWIGDLLEIPNPPTARDDEGRLHQGRKVDYPALRKTLENVELERSYGTYQPDIYAQDNVGELLIEIRVTHAVDERKAARVQAHGRRMVEIDLSRLDRVIPHDPAAFEQAVLFDPSNRTWISCPEAVANWRASKDELDLRIANFNEQLARQRELAAKATQARLEREAWAAKDKSTRRDYVRKLERNKRADDLAQLKELASPDRVSRVLHDYQVSAEARVSELLDAASAATRSACLRAHPDAWIFGVDPVLWQLLAYDHFVGKAAPGSRFNQKDVAEWVRGRFPYERPLYRLFVTQYAKRAEARRAGFAKRQLGYWAFTEEENALIPNFYAPINDFVDRLESARLVRRLPAPIGECEVSPPSPSGFNPIAAIAPGNILGMQWRSLLAL